MPFKEKTLRLVTHVTDYVLLGVATIAGLAGAPGIAIAGVAIYLTGAKVFKRL